MGKYLIHKDFKKYNNMKPPIYKSLLPLINKSMGILFSMEKSDKYVSVSHKKITTDKKETISILLYEPKKLTKKAPCLLYIHGGAFMLKGAPYHYSLARKYAKEAECKVVFVDYRLAPKYSYPTPLNDCLDTLKWIVNNADDLVIDKDKIAVGGDSAGGNLAAAISLVARDELKINLCFQLLIYPVIDRRMQTDSMKKYIDTPMWNAKLSKKMWEYYLKDIKSEDLKYTSLLEGNSLHNLPKTYIEAAEFDCLHDEAICYAEALKKAGNDVELTETYGTIHGYDIVLDSEIVTSSIKKRVNFIRNSFSS